MKKLSILIIAIIILNTPNILAQTKTITVINGETVDLEEVIDNYLNSFPKHEKFSGVVLIANGNEILYHKGYDMANREFGVPNGENTRFQIGSITKAFTTMLVLKMVENGLLDLDKTISDYLPYYPKETGERITINHLLSCTSGIPQHINAVPSYWDIHDNYFHSTKELLELFWDVPLKHDPGEQWTYSSPGFYIIGAILQQVSKKSYAELLQEYIFTPLGMKNTFVENNKTTDVNLATGYKRGLNGLVKVFGEDKSTALAAGDMLSTAYDLYLWQKTLSMNADQILSAESKKKMYKPVLPDMAMTYMGPVYNIPCGDGKEKLTLNYINGSSEGYMSFIGREIVLDRCIIVLSNISDADVTRIGDDISDIYSRYFLKMPAGAAAPLTKTPPKATKIDKSEIDKVLGVYRQAKKSYTNIVKNDGKLYSLAYIKGSGKQMVMELIPYKIDTFYLSHNTSFRCIFTNEKDDGTLIMSTSRNGRTFYSAKKHELKKVDNSEYTGYFTSLELQKTYRFFIKSDELIAEKFLGDNNEVLIQLEKDLFSFDQGFIEFHRDKNGEISEFKVFNINTDSYNGSKFIKIVF